MCFDWSCKSLIGVIHLDPLPGSPRYGGSFEEVLSNALRDAAAYAEGGVDAVIVENYNDRPFKLRARDPETVAALAVIAREVRRETGLVVGINMLRCSGSEAVAVAVASGARFIRVNALVEPLAAPEGFLEPTAREIAEAKSRLKADVAVLADVNVKHAKSMLSIEEASFEARDRGLADALIVTGQRTGEAPEPAHVVVAKMASGLPVLVGSGVNPGNLRLYWDLADGFIVGSYFKVNGRVYKERVEKMVRLVRELRCRRT